MRVPPCFLQSEAAVYFGQRQDHGTLQGGFVGLVHGEVQLARKVPEDHAVATVFGGQWGNIHRPIAVDVAVIASGNQLHVAVFVKG